MPKPTSARQYRFLRAVESGTARKDTSLTPAQAHAGLQEVSHEQRSKFAKQSKHVIRLKRKNKGRS